MPAILCLQQLKAVSPPARKSSSLLLQYFLSQGGLSAEMNYINCSVDSF
jgi:hypothetical protein